MAGGDVHVFLNPALINPFLFKTSELSARRAADKVADRANMNVRAAGRVRTGKLAGSYRAVPHKMGLNSASFQVGSPLEYAVFQEDGIGPVHARPGGVLRFQPKGSAVFIFRRRTKGFRGAHQLRRAYESLSLSDFL